MCRKSAFGGLTFSPSCEILLDIMSEVLHRNRINFGPGAQGIHLSGGTPFMTCVAGAALHMRANHETPTFVPVLH